MVLTFLCHVYMLNLHDSCLTQRVDIWGVVQPQTRESCRAGHELSLSKIDLILLKPYSQYYIINAIVTNIQWFIAKTGPQLVVRTLQFGPDLRQFCL